MTKENMKILLLFIIAFIFSTTSILINNYFDSLLSSTSSGIYLEYLVEGVYGISVGIGIVCFIAAVILLIKNRN